MAGRSGFSTIMEEPMSHDLSVLNLDDDLIASWRRAPPDTTAPSRKSIARF